MSQIMNSIQEAQKQSRRKRKIKVNLEFEETINYLYYYRGSEHAWNKNKVEYQELMQCKDQLVILSEKEELEYENGVFGYLDQQFDKKREKKQMDGFHVYVYEQRRDWIKNQQNEVYIYPIEKISTYIREFKALTQIQEFKNNKQLIDPMKYRKKEKKDYGI